MMEQEKLSKENKSRNQKKDEYLDDIDLPPSESDDAEEEEEEEEED